MDEECVLETIPSANMPEAVFEKGKVSVIMPAYNCERFIGESIQSVQKQTYANWELIVVNDASTDHTADEVLQYQKLDHRIKLINLAVNSGTQAARNTAIRNSSGQYIAFLDSDDLWEPDKLKEQIAFMQANGYGFTFTAYHPFSSEVNGRKKTFHVPHSITYSQYLKNTIIGNLTVMIDRNLIPNVYVVQGELEDTLTWMNILKTGIIAHGLDQDLAAYRVYRASRSGNKAKNAIRYFRCLHEYQHISVMKSIGYEAGYIMNAISKRLIGKTIIN